MRLSAAAKLWLVTLGLAVIGLAVVVLTIKILDRAGTAPANGTTQAHTRYAQLYEGAWRADEQNDVVLMTATLVTPELLQSLKSDTQRGTTEDQILQFVQNLPATSMAIIVTADSVTGAIPDTTFQTGLTLTADPAQAFTNPAWHPMITPSRVVHAPPNTSSQSGVAVFSSELSVNWSSLKLLKLEATNIGNVPMRSFTWTKAIWLTAE